MSPSTQNQAMNALVFLHRQVLDQPPDGMIDVVRAERKVNLRAVLTRRNPAQLLGSRCQTSPSPKLNQRVVVTFC